MQNCTSVSSVPQTKVKAHLEKNQIPENKDKSSVAEIATQFFSSYMDDIVDYSIKFIATIGLVGTFKLQSVIEKAISLSIFALHTKIHIDRVDARGKIKNLQR